MIDKLIFLFFSSIAAIIVDIVVEWCVQTAQGIIAICRVIKEKKERVTSAIWLTILTGNVFLLIYFIVFFLFVCLFVRSVGFFTKKTRRVN